MTLNCVSNFSAPRDLFERVDAVAGRRGRSAFLREAAELLLRQCKEASTAEAAPVERDKALVHG